MDAREFAEWIAYDNIEPLPGGNREDQRAGTIVSAIVNKDKPKRARAHIWSDFFPPYERRVPRTDGWRGLLAKIAGINATLGGEDRRKTEPARDN